METINTVNFEDLFDFSPEPVDQVAGGGGTSGHTHPEEKQHQQQQERDVFADFDAVLAGGGVGGNVINTNNHLAKKSRPEEEDYSGGFKLSASVPSNWSGGGGNNSSTTPSSSADTKFTVGSVGQLLNELPSAAAATATAASSQPATATVPVKSKRGRKPGQKSLRTDMKTKLERSRQSARECRARKKLRYQYLDDLILEREKANAVLRDELSRFQKWCHELDKGRIPDGLQNMLMEHKAEQQQQNLHQQHQQTS